MKIYSGTTGDGALHEKGVALMLSRQAVKNLVEWKPISGRIIMAKFESKSQKITIIEAYAPTNETDKDEKDGYFTIN